jgi:hypothetical protein
LNFGKVKLELPLLKDALRNFEEVFAARQESH